MKKLLIMLLAICASLTVNAQMFRVYKDGQIVYAVSNPDSIVGVPPCDPMETVDLGLPSGTLWATCNIGAQVPEDIGDYYQWGCLAPASKTIDALNNQEGYALYANPHNVWENSTSVYKFSKYNAEDGKTVLDKEDDVAYVMYGENWQIPSREQNEELYKNTTITSEVVNGVPVLRYTAKNGKYIIMPKGGRGISQLGWHTYRVGNEVYFWLNCLDQYDPENPYSYGLNSGMDAIVIEDGKEWYARDGYSETYRQGACPVRPVYTPSK